MSYTLVVQVDEIDSVEGSVQQHVGAPPLAAPALGKASLAPTG
jgi:hypothetical protein